MKAYPDTFLPQNNLSALAVICAHHAARIPCTYATISNACGWSSRNAAFIAVKRLLRLGLVKQERFAHERGYGAGATITPTCRIILFQEEAR